jgi:hypothetical protein
MRDEVAQPAVAEQSLPASLPASLLARRPRMSPSDEEPVPVICPFRALRSEPDARYRRAAWTFAGRGQRRRAREVDLLPPEGLQRPPHQPA